VPEAEQPPPGGCLLVVGFEGATESVLRRRDAAAALLADAGATCLGTGPGERWRGGRFEAPYLRDALLDAGLLAETLETAAFWSRLPEVYDAVGAALQRSLAAQGTPPMVMCHVSHVYPTGASLYLTVVAAQAADPLGQWRSAKAAASDAISSLGATITHHHAVGTEHRPWLAAEIGDIGVDVLRAVKRRLDPVGILNPGVLVPPGAPEPEPGY
jgi:alkyldihydroxyacetonephosphate synthase